MTTAELEIALAEATVALQRIQILALRNCLSVSDKEVSEAVAPTSSFRKLTPAVRAHVIRIRKERWNIQ